MFSQETCDEIYRLNKIEYAIAQRKIENDLDGVLIDTVIIEKGQALNKAKGDLYIKRKNEVLEMYGDLGYEELSVVFTESLCCFNIQIESHEDLWHSTVIGVLNPVLEEKKKNHQMENEINNLMEELI